MTTQIVDVIEFPCEEWVALRKADGELVSVNPVAGTWTLIDGNDRRKFFEKGMNVKAMFACPRCKHIGIIGEGFNPPTAFGDTGILPEMHCSRCQFGCRIILKDWDKRKLYCAAYETGHGDTLVIHKQYLHAVNEMEAKKFFWAQHPMSEGVHLVGIAPVVGFFAVSKDEKKLIV